MKTDNVSRFRRAARLNELMDRHPSLRYAAAAVFMGVIAVRDGSVLSTYPLSTAGSWLTFTIGAVIAVGAVTLVVTSSPAIAELKDHAGWVVLAGACGVLIIFGGVEGLGFTSVGGTINLAGESAVVRSFACGAALGGVALFGLGSRRAARIARERRSSAQTTSDAAALSDDSRGF
jgi:hypothetical protein